MADPSTSRASPNSSFGPPVDEQSLAELMRVEPLVDRGAAPAPARSLPAAPAAEDGQGGWGLVPLMLDASRMVLVAVTFYVLFFNLSVVRGSSMTPGIRDGDRILVEPWSYIVGGAERGDVIVMRYPLDPRVDYIKRIIGLPGDRVTLANGHLWVNGELISEPYVDDVDPSSYLSVDVEQGHYFVLGDNRARSSDSREFGLVSDEFIRGRVDLRLWPLSRLGWID